jgi:predicted ATPase/class 3 adenylate cyclase
VTLLFTDIEGSTKLLQRLGAERYATVLERHRELLREPFQRRGGFEFGTEGDAFFVAFASASEALGAAVEGQQALARGAWPDGVEVRVRMGIHTGEPLTVDANYLGIDVHRVARIMSVGHGGQVLVSNTTAELVDGAQLRDLGFHRLKDLLEPIQLYQAAIGGIVRDFPPLKTISNSNLPRPASSFVGREHELAEVLAKVEDGARLVTLTGPGGSGKTRLALEAGAELVSWFTAGVFWVGLAALREPGLVMETIATTLGARDGLAEHIGEREMLLLLDNLEQVIEVAPDLSVLVAACPNLTLLVTSRELLRVQGEVEYPVPPLASLEAVTLFCQRSALASSEAIAELCARLDNLPLAVELAAARTRVLSPAQILERLSQRLDLFRGGRDAEARQQTLRATIAWSYDLLAPDEQRGFRSLSVFAAGCELTAAEEVAGADLDTLQSLVDKSLLRFSNERYWMLETIREYATERLQAQPEAGEIFERHTRFYAELSASAHGELRGPSQAEWLERLDPELENLRTAIRWAHHHDDALEVELAGTTWFFLALRGLLHEALGYLRHAIDTAEHTPSLDRSELLYGGAYVALRTGDHAAVERWSEQRLALGRARGDAPVIARSLVGLAHAAWELGDQKRTQTLFLEAAEVARDCGDSQTLGMAVHNLGILALQEGDTETARLHFRQGLALFREMSDELAEGDALAGLASLALDVGEIDEAAALVADSLRLASRLGDREGMFHGLINAADVAARRGETLRAARLLGAADALRAEIGYRPADVSEQDQRARIDDLLDKNDPAQVAAQSEGSSMSLDDAVELALSPA